MKRLELLFENEEGRTVTFTLDEPIDPADPAAVNAAMDEVLAQNVFESSGGNLVKKKGARIVERTVTDIDIDVD